MAPVAPHLAVKGGVAALAFYQRAFGAVEQMRMMAEDGTRVMHASFTINGGLLMLHDDFPEFRKETTGFAEPPEGLRGTSVTIHLAVADADAAWQRAVDAGATVLMPLADQFWGDRYGQLRDPFGHVWSIGAPAKKG